MSYFELPEEALRQLSDEQLETLVLRLAEAEVVANGGHVSDVRGSGASDAPDGGVDVRVDVSVEGFNSGFLPRSKVIFQAKKHTMPPRGISKEMCPGGQLQDAIAKQAESAGAYILVSLKDDCSDLMHDNRRKAMTAAMGNNPYKDRIHLDFYDRSKLRQWLRQHPGVTLWLRNAIGQLLSGWQPYGRWSHPPADDDDTLILADGVSITVPDNCEERLTIKTAIPAVRKLARETAKAVRVIGLSGVGKTRFVQALFEETVGVDPLARTQAIYGDTGADLQPSAHTMVETLISERRSAIVVVDNCSAALHGELAKRVAASPAQTLKLITVEYDIREDQPQTTDVVCMTANGTDTAKQLLYRRYPDIGLANAHRVAAFAEGNAKVAIALAANIKPGESLASLKDDDLFNRLFYQRNQPDETLRRHAEALALVYSYAVEKESGIDELAVLGQLVDATSKELFRATATLLERGIAQKRGKWRAILPQAIANRLAARALHSILPEDLLKTFNHSSRRLCKSFAHRLGMLHDHEVAQAIAKRFLPMPQQSVSMAKLDNDGAWMLEYLAPVIPQEILEWIDNEINASCFKGLNPENYSSRMVTTITDLLASLAYEKSMFDRCIKFLIRISDFEDNSNRNRDIYNRISSFFNPYPSETHATPDQREAIMRDMIWDKNPKYQGLGLKILDAALSQPTDLPRYYWYMNEFGSRSRDGGYCPNNQQLIQWYQRFITVAVEASCDNDSNISHSARCILAKYLCYLWSQISLRDQLTGTIKRLNQHQYWIEGYEAILEHFIIYYKTSKEDKSNLIPASFKNLKNILEPKDLVNRILFFAFGHDLLHSYNVTVDSYYCNRINSKKPVAIRLTYIIEKLGEEFSQQNMNINTLGDKVFTTIRTKLQAEGPASFGKGLATGSRNLKKTWQTLVNGFARCADNCTWTLTYQRCWPLVTVLSGFLEKVEQLDQPLLQQLLNQAANDDKLQTMIVNLHPRASFDCVALERCLRVLECPMVGPQMYGQLLYYEEYPDLPPDRMVTLAEKLLRKEGGYMTLVYALGEKLREKENSDTLGMELRRIGLVAAAQIIRNCDDTYGYHVLVIVRNCLFFSKDDNEKDKWLDRIFTILDQERYRFRHNDILREAVQITASILLEHFLDRVFDEDDTVRDDLLLSEGNGIGFPLAEAGTDRLIQWCKKRNESIVWYIIGKAIGFLTLEDTFSQASQLQKTKELTEQELTELRRRFLEACPDPKAVMDAYAETVEPIAWSGSRSQAIRKRLDTRFQPLADHSDQTIAAHAKSIIDRFQSRIEDARKWDQHRHQVFEQSFEP